MSTGGNIGGLNITLSATGLQLVQAALDAVQVSLGGMNVLTNAAQAGFNAMKAGAAKAVEGMAFQLFNAGYAAQALKEKLDTGLYDEFAETLARVKREADFGGQLTRLHDGLASLKDVLHPGVYRQFADEIRDLDAALKTGNIDRFTGDLARLSKELGLADRAKAARESIQLVSDLLRSDIAGQLGAGLGQLKTGEDVARGALAARDAINQLEGAIDPALFQRFEQQIHEVRVSLARMDFTAAKAGLESLKGALGFEDRLKAAREQVEALRTSIGSGISGERAGRAAEAEVIPGVPTALGKAPSTKMGVLQGVQQAQEQFATLRASLPTADLSKLEAQFKALESAAGAGNFVAMAAGLEKVKKQIDWSALVAQHGLLGASLRKLAGDATATGQSFQAGFAKAVAMGQLAADSIKGFVRAGLSGTAEGAVLAVQFQLISREIASVFLPTIQFVIDSLRRVFDWFRSLSGAQQETIRHWAEAAAAMLAVTVILPKLASLFTGILLPAFTLVKTIMIGGIAEIGTALGVASGGIIPLIGIVVTAITGLIAGTSAGRSALAGLFDFLRPIFDLVSSIFGAISETLTPIFEGLGEVFAPILEALQLIFELVAAIAGPVLKLVGIIGGLLGGVIGNILGFIGQILGAIVKVAEYLTSGILGIFFDILGVIGRIAETIFGPIIEGIKGAIGWLQKIPIIGRLFGGGKEEKPGAARHEVGAAGGQFEQAGDLFKRIQSAALQQTSDPAQNERRRHTQLLERIANNTGRPTPNGGTPEPIVPGIGP